MRLHLSEPEVDDARFEAVPFTSANDPLNLVDRDVKALSDALFRGHHDRAALLGPYSADNPDEILAADAAIEGKPIASHLQSTAELVRIVCSAGKQDLLSKGDKERLEDFHELVASIDAARTRRQTEVAPTRPPADVRLVA